MWARYRQKPSMDSVTSDFSNMLLGRPDIGGKISFTEHGMPLKTISTAEHQVVGTSLGR